MWDSKRPVLPFDENGNMLGYAFDEPTEEDIDKCYSEGKSVHTYKDGRVRTEFRPFKNVLLSLHYIDYSRGRSSVKFIYRDSDEHKYEMFISDIHDLLRMVTRSIGYIYGYFTAVKRGANYGIVFDKEY